jgi:alkyl sulfatase BDS1-like metallo-beta-lactamase superfamily hydrolase
MEPKAHGLASDGQYRPRGWPVTRCRAPGAAALLVLLAACSSLPDTEATARSPAPREPHAAAGEASSPVDAVSFAEARRGFIAAPKGQVRDAADKVIWDFDAFAFVHGAAPATVNPSLWRQALLNNQIGLFKVTEGIWQLRGFDLANITLIEGKTGWIVVDTTTTRETAAVAMAFARRHLGDKPVSALIYTHSHVDTFGGSLAVLGADEAKARQVPVVAPAGFMTEAVSENILMGPAMSRRAAYMYGSLLTRSATGLVDDGLGKAATFGQIGLLPPTVLIEQATQTLVLDGVRFVFYNMPGSEAPAQLTFYLPERRAFCGSDLMSHTLHNLYTLRGTKVRDALLWADHLDATRGHASDAEVVFNQHNWPVWGQARISEFIGKQSDIYRFIHDQTVRLMNAGLTGPEIAETLQLPKSLQDHLDIRGYYGTVRHNVRGVYQFYLGWFDAHPSNLNALPPVEAGRRYVELAGGIDKLLSAARTAQDAGDHRWAAELLKHAVYADPKDARARELLAKSFEQMGYAAEASTWRNIYLTGALELRQGPPAQGFQPAAAIDMLKYAPIERILEAMATRLDGAKAGSIRIKINLVFSDLNEIYVLDVENAVMHSRRARPAPDADATLTLTKAFFLRMATGDAGAMDLLLSDQTRIEGSRIALGRFFSLLEKTPGNFPIVTR